MRRHRELGWWGLAGLGAVVGLVCEYRAGTSVLGWSRPENWVPDLLAGLVLLACAGWEGSRERAGDPPPLAWPARAQQPAVLLLATALAWFAGTAWPAAQLWHRATLLHLLLTYRGVALPRRRARALAVVVGYLFCAVPVTGPAGLPVGAANGLVAAALAAVAAALLVGRRNGRRLDDLVVALVATGWAALLIRGSLASATPLLLDAYLVAVCGLALAVTVALASPGAVRVTDLAVQVVELGAGAAGTLQQSLRRAARDPTLQLGVWSPAAGEYLTPEGRPVPPGAGSTRTRTPVDRDGQPFVVLVHDLDASGAAALVAAITAASRLGEAHSALQAELGHQVEEVTRSRRRLLVAADLEARRLEEQLRSGPVRTLTAMAERVRALRNGLAAGPVADALDAAVIQMAGTLDDLEALAGGLHPKDLDQGLPAALRALAARSPVPVVLDVDGSVAGRRRPADVEATVYFVTAEALANVAKHADATCVRVCMQATDDDLTWTVTDDGSGGAEPAAGTGLQGLADRIEALGGSLTVRSAAGEGTELAARLPLRPHQRSGT